MLLRCTHLSNPFACSLLYHITQETVLTTPTTQLAKVQYYLVFWFPYNVIILPTWLFITDISCHEYIFLVVIPWMMLSYRMKRQKH